MIVVGLVASCQVIIASLGVVALEDQQLKGGAVANFLTLT